MKTKVLIPIIVVIIITTVVLIIFLRKKEKRGLLHITNGDEINSKFLKWETIVETNKPNYLKLRYSENKYQIVMFDNINDYLIKLKNGTINIRKIGIMSFEATVTELDQDGNIAGKETLIYKPKTK